MKHTPPLALAFGLAAFASIAATPKPTSNMTFDWNEIVMLRGSIETKMTATLQRISECTQRGDTSCASVEVYQYTALDRLRIRMIESFEALTAEYNTMKREQ